LDLNITNLPPMELTSVETRMTLNHGSVSVKRYVKDLFSLSLGLIFIVVFPHMFYFSMNAFDLINKSGTLDLTRLLRNAESKEYKSYHAQFTTRAPLYDIKALLESILDEMPYIGYSFDKVFLVVRKSGLDLKVLTLLKLNKPNFFSTM
jgi:hypothetical protein